ncbi:hypothetical protein [Aquipuribacter hungaricus]|uniref:hypothetical protein n=1 Tax=Aquipuribacter hungaricus TaxID=545624 RepID=UPI003670D620
MVHVPGEHAYVRHATTLPQQRPAPAGSPESPASPGSSARPAFAWREGAAWLTRHGADVDVLHVHFGMEQVDADGLLDVLRAAGRAGVAVVWTVHDLTNPHLVDQTPHEAQLALLAEHAAGLVTLTPGAAAEVEQRWGRRPVVVRHPHLAPPARMAAPRAPAAGPPVVLVPLGLLRPATDPVLVRALLSPEVSRALPAGTLLRVTLREEVLADSFPRPDADLVARLRAAEDDGRVRLVVGPRTNDAVLWDELAAAAALVLPYRWGTHSGWVESCHDVGTPVVAPAVGRWGEQQRVHTVAPTIGPAIGPVTGPADVPADALVAALADALAAALEEGPRTEPVLQERLEQRAASVAEHARLHALAAAGGRW